MTDTVEQNIERNGETWKRLSAQLVDLNKGFVQKRAGQSPDKYGQFGEFDRIRYSQEHVYFWEGSTPFMVVHFNDTDPEKTRNSFGTGMSLWGTPESMAVIKVAAEVLLKRAFNLSYGDARKKGHKVGLEPLSSDVLEKCAMPEGSVVVGMWPNCPKDGDGPIVPACCDMQTKPIGNSVDLAPGSIVKAMIRLYTSERPPGGIRVEFVKYGDQLQVKKVEDRTLFVSRARSSNFQAEEDTGEVVVDATNDPFES